MIIRRYDNLHTIYYAIILYGLLKYDFLLDYGYRDLAFVFINYEQHQYRLLYKRIDYIKKKK